MYNTKGIVIFHKGKNLYMLIFDMSMNLGDTSMYPGHELPASNTHQTLKNSYWIDLRFSDDQISNNIF
jgi:hypothetical protein